MTKNAREILRDLLPYNEELWFSSPDRLEDGDIDRREEEINQSLSDLAELVLAEKREVSCYEPQDSMDEGFNNALEHIATKLKES